MYDVSDSYLDAFKSKARRINGAVVCVTDSGDYTMAPNGNLISFTIEKTAPQGKLFGFAISQKITIEVIGILDNIKKGNRLIPSIHIKDLDEEELLLPYFYIDTVEHNKVKNRTTIVGYDILHKLDTMRIDEFEITYPTYALNYALDILEPVGGYAHFEGINHLIREAPNLNGDESARSVLIALAEFTGSICYVSSGDTVKFRGMSPSDFTDVLTADDYFDLSVGGEIITLTQIASHTELGDNSAYGNDGYSQIIWENPFLNKVDEVDSLIIAIGNQVLNTTTTSYKLTWRGCPAYELGDFVILQERDGSAQYAIYFNEKIVFNGGLKVTSEWEPVESESIKPPNITQSLKQTIAKVDKVNQEIQLVASKCDELEEKMSKIEIEPDSITSVVTKVEKLEEIVDANTGRINTLTNKVSQMITAEDVRIQIEETLEEGVEKVITKTGFTFDEEGLTIEKSDSIMKTVITEDGMTIYRSNQAALEVNNEGVKAEDLHATTYLLIGNNSRFEDYLGSRTGCFWIGKV